MSDMFDLAEASAPDPSPPQLGAVDGMRMGWRLLGSQFWGLSLLALVMALLNLGVYLLGSFCGFFVPFVGGCISMTVQLAASLFFAPQLTAGFVFALRQKIDGRRPPVGHLFAAFRWRYWEALVAVLPNMIIGMVIGMVTVTVVVIAFTGFVMQIIQQAQANPGNFSWSAVTMPSVMAFVAAGAGVLGGLVATMIAQLYFMFTTVAVWDCRGRYWEVISLSARIVRDHFWAALGTAALFWAVYLVAVLLPALIVGGVPMAMGAVELIRLVQSGELDGGGGGGAFPLVALAKMGLGYLLFFITMGLLACPWQVWYESTLIYLYRSWQSQPLTQPPLEVSHDGKLLLEEMPEEIGIPPAEPLT